MRGRIPQQPPPPCTPLVAVIIVAAATATVLADTVAAFLGLVRAIHECGDDVEAMRRRESLKPSRREKSSFQATSSSLRSLVVPRPSAPFPEEASAAIPSAMKLVPSKGGMLVPSEIDFTHSRTQTTLTQFALVVLASAPSSNSGQGGRGISLPLTGKGPTASARPVRPLSLPPLGSRPPALSFPVRHRGKYRGCSVLAIAINGGRRREQRFRAETASGSRIRLLPRRYTRNRAVRNQVPR